MPVQLFDDERLFVGSGLGETFVDPTRVLKERIRATWAAEQFGVLFVPKEQ